MTCNCNKNNTCQYFHKSTSVTTDGTNLIITCSNSSEKLNQKTPFCLVICQSLSNLENLPAVVTIDGTNYPLYDKDGVQITTSNLPVRSLLKGRYVINGSSTYVIFRNVPMCEF